MIILNIDTSDSKIAKMELTVNDNKHLITSDSRRISSQTCLVLVDKLIAQAGIRLEDLTEIKVNVGPGSFTGLRVGVSIANTLAYFLKIPVNGEKIGDLVLPVYN